MKEIPSLFRYRQSRKSELGEKCTCRDLCRLTLPLQVLYEINPYFHSPWVQWLRFSAWWCLIHVDWHFSRPQLELREIMGDWDFQCILTSTSGGRTWQFSRSHELGPLWCKEVQFHNCTLYLINGQQNLGEVRSWVASTKTGIKDGFDEEEHAFPSGTFFFRWSRFSGLESFR